MNFLRLYLGFINIALGLFAITFLTSAISLMLVVAIQLTLLFVQISLPTNGS